MLQRILESTGFEPQQCAKLLGMSPRIFGEWLAGQRPIPPSVLPLLSDVFGVQVSTLLLSPKQARSRGAADLTPAIWYKFRGERLLDADRECVLLVRQLGHYVNELEEVTGKKAVTWKAIFEGIRREIDVQAPPREQGRQAARILREATGLAHGASGIGTVFRGYLRRTGLLMIETPVPESQVEGFSFYVGAHPAERPCVFANTHHSTWFRRNLVLMHEVGHVIFDAASEGASLDFVNTEEGTDLSEQRAQAFAQEALLPKEVLHHISQGMKWDALTPTELAALVAEGHVEQKVVIKAALEAQFITAEQADNYLSLDISDELRQATDRALSTKEYVRRHGKEAASKLLLGKRTTTIPPRSIRLPVPYVVGVINALKSKTISHGKAAELLMIDRDTFEERFGELLDVQAA